MSNELHNKRISMKRNTLFQILREDPTGAFSKGGKTSSCGNIEDNWDEKISRPNFIRTAKSEDAQFQELRRAAGNSLRR